MNKKLLIIFSFLIMSFFTIAQTVKTFAGKERTDPYDGHDIGNPAQEDALLNQPYGIAFNPNGVMLTTENDRVRALSGTTFYTRVGARTEPGTTGGYRNGLSNVATFRTPLGIVLSSDESIFICDYDNWAVRKMTKYANISSGHQVSTFAGAEPNNQTGFGTQEHKDGTATGARFNGPRGLAIDNQDNLYVADWFDHTIRKITASGVVTTLAGTPGEGAYKNGSGAAALFNSPQDVAIYDANHILVTDQLNGTIRKVNTSNGTTETFAGTGTTGFKDGNASEAQFSQYIAGIAVVNGVVFVCDNTRIRMIKDGVVSTLAGSGTSGNVDGEGADAQFGQLGGMTYNPKNSLIYVTDLVYNIIKTVSVPSFASVNNSKIDLSINIYPNPSANWINIHSVQNITPMAKVNIVSLDGKMIKTMLWKDLNNGTLDISNLNQGLYSLSIEDDQYKGQKKIVVAR